MSRDCALCQLQIQLFMSVHQAHTYKYTRAYIHLGKTDFTFWHCKSFHNIFPLRNPYRISLFFIWSRQHAEAVNKKPKTSQKKSLIRQKKNLFKLLNLKIILDNKYFPSLQSVFSPPVSIIVARTQELGCSRALLWNMIF